MLVALKLQSSDCWRSLLVAAYVLLCSQSYPANNSSSSSTQGIFVLHTTSFWLFGRFCDIAGFFKTATLVTVCSMGTRFEHVPQHRLFLTRAGRVGGPFGRLPDAPTHKRRRDCRWQIDVLTGGRISPKIIHSLGTRPTASFSSPILGRKSSKNIGFKGP